MARADENHTNRMSSGSDTQAHPLLGDYEFQRKIGSGAFGTVWQFFDPENGRDVAVKRLSIVENLDAHAAKV